MPERRGGLAAESAGLVGRFFRLIGRGVRGEVVKRTGGPARARVIVLFALVLALNGADASTVGAIAPQLKSGLNIDITDIGLLASVSLLVGAVFTIPVGFLVDRTKRMPILSLSIVLWSFASLFSAFAGSFSTLLLTRLALGAVAAAAGPAIASLTGDYFSADERGRVWSYILVGEAAGTAFGFIVSGLVASAIDWRAAFVVLSIPGFFLARELSRTVPEPLRGGQSRLEVGDVDLHLAVARHSARADRGEAPGESAPAADAAAEAAREAARAKGVAPNPRLVLHEDPSKMGLGASIRYIFSIPSNALMIIGSSLGYFYFAGLQTFALLFVKGHLAASQTYAELVLALLVVGAVAGTLVGGRLPDRLLKRGYLSARVAFPGVCYLAAAACLLPGLLFTSRNPAIWFFVVGAGLISAANPPLQAARLDVVPAGLWGRAQSALTVVRSLAQAAAPIVFGGISQLVAGVLPSQAPIGTHVKPPSSHTTTGLEVTFLIMLATLGTAGWLLFRAKETFASDVATAAASEPGATGAPPPEPPPPTRRLPRAAESG
ncbi:MAG TPA: MFS transporter [Solirubrobacteraceae bacterium]|nr:MFS transporter [Solirubrobacteraceae bacterium]